MIVTISQNVSLDFKYLDNNIQQHLLNKLKNSMINTCSMSNGYILDIIEIININSNLVSTANTKTVFNIIYTAETLNPQKGQVIEGTVCMVFDNGIFVNHLDKLKILVPKSSLNGEDLHFNGESKSFEGDESTIEVGSNVSVKLSMIKYEEKEFKCIGEIVM